MYRLTSSVIICYTSPIVTMSVCRVVLSLLYLHFSLLHHVSASPVSATPCIPLLCFTTNKSLDLIISHLSSLQSISALTSPLPYTEYPDQSAVLFDCVPNIPSPSTVKDIGCTSDSNTFSNFLLSNAASTNKHTEPYRELYVPPISSSAPVLPLSPVRQAASVVSLPDRLASNAAYRAQTRAQVYNDRVKDRNAQIMEGMQYGQGGGGANILSSSPQYAHPQVPQMYPNPYTQALLPYDLVGGVGRVRNFLAGYGMSPATAQLAVSPAQSAGYYPLPQSSASPYLVSPLLQSVPPMVARDVLLPAAFSVQDVNRRVYQNAKQASTILNDFNSYRQTPTNNTLVQLVNLLDEATQTVEENVAETEPTRTDPLKPLKSMNQGTQTGGGSFDISSFADTLPDAVKQTMTPKQAEQLEFLNSVIGTGFDAALSMLGADQIKSNINQPEANKLHQQQLQQKVSTTRATPGTMQPQQQTHISPTSLYHTPQSSHESPVSPSLTPHTRQPIPPYTYPIFYPSAPINSQYNRATTPAASQLLQGQSADGSPLPQGSIHPGIRQSAVEPFPLHPYGGPPPLGQSILSKAHKKLIENLERDRLATAEVMMREAGVISNTNRSSGSASKTKKTEGASRVQNATHKPGRTSIDGVPKAPSASLKSPSQTMPFHTRHLQVVENSDMPVEDSLAHAFVSSVIGSPPPTGSPLADDVVVPLTPVVDESLPPIRSSTLDVPSPAASTRPAVGASELPKNGSSAADVGDGYLTRNQEMETDVEGLLGFEESLNSATSDGQTLRHGAGETGGEDWLPSGSQCLLRHTAYTGYPLIHSAQDTLQSCHVACQNTPSCNFFSYRLSPFYACTLFADFTNVVPALDVISGAQQCPIIAEPPPSQFLTGMQSAPSPSNPNFISPIRETLLQTIGRTAAYTPASPFLGPLTAPLGSPPSPPLPNAYPPAPPFSPNTGLGSSAGNTGGLITGQQAPSAGYGMLGAVPMVPIVGSPSLYGPVMGSTASDAANLFHTSQAMMEAGSAFLNAFPMQQLVSVGSQLQNTGFFRSRGIKALGGPGLGVEKAALPPPPGVGNPTVSCHEQGLTCCVPESSVADWQDKPPFLNGETNAACRGLFASVQTAVCATTSYSGAENCGLQKIETSSHVIYRHTFIIPDRVVNNAICECKRDRNKDEFEGFASWEYSIHSVEDEQETKKRGETLARGVNAALAWTNLINQHGSAAAEQIASTTM
eukprot:GHVQ01015849.1.p1 GENE.GHVQ01015849.1~~GHVQ01015849.1.p1  ORF type:complete len:1227 (-),score=188.23 GHVQ01015849.1:3984-7664(-)